VPVGRGAVVLHRFVKGDAVMWEPQQPDVPAVTVLDRFVPNVLAVYLEQIEGAKDGAAVAAMTADQSNTAIPLSSHTIASASTTHDLIGSASIAAAASGKRSAKSLPLRVRSRAARP
jgi:hypothetical protein